MKKSEEDNPMVKERKMGVMGNFLYVDRGI